MDFLSASDLPEKSMDQESIIKVFFEPNRYVKRVAEKLPDFFKCSVKIFEPFKEDIPVLTAFTQLLSSAEVLAVNYRFIPSLIKQRKIKSPMSLFIVPPSPSAPLAIQEPLASFNYGRIWVSTRFYGALSSNEKCGLAIHEALRLINFGNFLQSKISTEEIEIATIYFMGLSFSTDNYEAVLSKLKLTVPSADEYRQLAEESLLKAKQLGDFRAMAGDNLTDEQYKSFMKAERALRHQVDLAIANEGRATNLYAHDDVGFTTYDFIKAQLTEDLGPFQYFDTILGEVVFRLF